MRKSQSKLQKVAPATLNAARRHPFDVEVLNPEFVLCLECGAKARFLAPHLYTTHGLGYDDYKEKWGYNRGQALVSQDHSEKQRQGTIERSALTHLLKFPPSSRGVKPAQMRRQTVQSQRERALQNGRNCEERRDVTRDSVAELASAGLSIEDIAKQLGCSMSVVHSRLGPVRSRNPGRRDVTVETVRAL